jgi:hypothetical protein
MLGSSMDARTPEPVLEEEAELNTAVRIAWREPEPRIRVRSRAKERIRVLPDLHPKGQLYRGYFRICVSWLLDFCLMTFPKRLLNILEAAPGAMR